MKNILNKIKNIWNIKILRNKLLFTIFFLLIYRFGCYIPLLGINPRCISNFIEKLNENQSGLTSILSSFTGGAFHRASILALGIMPYISSCIIIQLISLIFPKLQKIQKDGESGKKYINKIIRYLTIIVCFIQAPAYLGILTNQFIPFSSMSNVYLINTKYLVNKIIFLFFSVILLTSGTFFTIWLGEKITEKGIGNGVSLIILSGLLSRFPALFFNEIMNRFNNIPEGGIYFLIFEILLWLIIVVIILIITQSVKKIPIQYVSGQNFGDEEIIKDFTLLRQYFPLKLTISGVMPIIFSQSIMLFPTFFSSYINKNFFDKLQDIYGILYNVIFFLLIIFFTFFYTAIIFPVNQITEDLKKSEAYIPNVKPGKKTSDYFNKILLKITIPSSLSLAFIAILPTLVVLIGISKNISLFYGGTSLLILIGVSLDIMKQIDIFLLNNYYDKISKKKNNILKL